jgi:hypothetical protein
MPLDLTHNHFGDYTPLSRTPSVFRGHTLGPSGDHLWGQDELEDRPHFGLVENARANSASGRSPEEFHRFELQKLRSS